jgi:hypothetical protein
MQVAMSPERPGLVVASYPVAERPLPLPMTPRRRLAAIRRWTGGFAEVLLVGLAVPAGVLLVGLPIALLIGLIIKITSWL